MSKPTKKTFIGALIIATLIIPQVTSFAHAKSVGTTPETSSQTDPNSDDAPNLYVGGSQTESTSVTVKVYNGLPKKQTSTPIKSGTSFEEALDSLVNQEVGRTATSQEEKQNLKQLILKNLRQELGAQVNQRGLFPLTIHISVTRHRSDGSDFTYSYDVVVHNAREFDEVRGYN
jgi:hypothetical protein